MADARVTAIAEHWTPRLLANGVEHDDLVRTLGSIESWDDWLGAWSRTAGEHAELMAGAQAAGHGRTAGEAALRAAVCFHVAKFNWPLGDDGARRATVRAAECLQQGLANLDPSAERVTAPVEGGLVVGTLRRPRPNVDTPPLVVLLGGFDSAKEEFVTWEQTFLDRGVATLSLDAPGQGETALELELRAGIEDALVPALDACAARGGLAMDRVGVAGVSLGGLYATRSAAFDDRVKAVAAISAPYDLGALWPELRGLLRATFAERARAADDDSARRLAAEMALDGVIEQVGVPVLVVAGGRDRVIPWEETRRLADGAADATWAFFADGNHACNNLAHRYRPLVADWFADLLAAPGHARPRNV